MTVISISVFPKEEQDPPDQLVCRMLFTEQSIDSTDVLVSEPVSINKFTFVNFIQAQLHNPKLNFSSVLSCVLCPHRLRLVLCRRYAPFVRILRIL